MRHTVRIVLTAALAVVFCESLYGWTRLGRPTDATTIRDLIEIPSRGLLLACGNAGSWPRIWSSSDSGRTWTDRASGNEWYEFTNLKTDEGSGRIWAGSTDYDYPVYFSEDDGITWSSISSPPFPYAISVRTLEVVEGSVYVSGSRGDEPYSPYSMLLYRLTPGTQEWELICQYPQCRAVTKLEYYFDRLLVFGLDYETGSDTRLFHHPLADLAQPGSRLGKGAVRKAAP